MTTVWIFINGDSVMKNTTEAYPIGDAIEKYLIEMYLNDGYMVNEEYFKDLTTDELYYLLRKYHPTENISFHMVTEFSDEVFKHIDAIEERILNQ